MKDYRKNGYVYIIDKTPTVVIEQLRKLGFEIRIGDGKLDDELLAGCWALYPSRSVISEEVLDKAPNLKLIAKQGVGVERIDVAACTRRGICVANTPYSNYISVAEHTITLLLDAAKQIYPLSVHLRMKGTETPYVKRYMATEVYGKTLAVIGTGRIGLRVAELAHGLGMEVIGYARHPEKVICPEYLTLTTSMEEAIRRADYLSLHVSGTRENSGLIGERELAMMKPTAVLINTTRGFIVDEKALYRALTSGVIAGAALDVFTDETMKLENNPLFRLENVVATPHTAANTRESRRRADMECVKILTDYADGKWPETAINQEIKEVVQ